MMKRSRRSVDLREQALAALATGMTQAQVCQVFGIHRSSLHRWIVRQHEGSLEDKVACGGPRKITVEQASLLVAQLQAHPDATLDEHKQFWHQQQGLVVSRATMARAIERVGWTRKKRV
jgi:transposase